MLMLLFLLLRFRSQQVAVHGNAAQHPQHDSSWHFRQTPPVGPQEAHRRRSGGAQPTVSIQVQDNGTTITVLQLQILSKSRV